jgi:hypothetical protein
MNERASFLHVRQSVFTKLVAIIIAVQTALRSIWKPAPVTKN